MGGNDASSILGTIPNALQDCSFFFFKVLFRPRSFGRETAPSAQESSVFIILSSAIIAVIVRFFEAATPAIVAWNNENSSVMVATIREWSDLQNHSNAAASVAAMAAWLAIFISTATLSMTAALFLLQWRWGTRKEFGDTFARSSIVVSTAILTVIFSEFLFPHVAESGASGWIVALLFLLCVLLVPLYVAFCMPFFVWRGALYLSRLRVVIAVLLSWPLAIQLVNLIPSDIFFPETRIDSLLSAELKRLALLGQKEQYEEADKIARQASSSYEDSIQLDSLTISLRSKAFAHAIQQPKISAQTMQENNWSTDVTSRYRDLVDTTDRLQIKYSDVPGMLLRIARAQLESGQCDKSEVIFEAVYHHRHAIIMERLLAGLYLRALKHEPDDFGRLLTLFSPADDGKFLRAFLASPGIGIGVFYSDINANGNRMVQLQKYAQDLLDKPPQWRCNFVGNSMNLQTYNFLPISREQVQRFNP